jgi:hypothetical protein
MSGFHHNSCFFARSLLKVQSKSTAAISMRLDVIITSPEFALYPNEVFGNSAVARAQIVPVSRHASLQAKANSDHVGAGAAMVTSDLEIPSLMKHGW